MFAEVDDQYRKDECLKREDVNELLEWARTQPHLPKIDELELILFLHSCYCNKEAAKTCMENYYTMRAKWPEFFSQLDICSPAIADQLTVIKHALLPTTTPEGYIVTYTNVTDTDASKFNHTVQIKIFDISMLVWARQLGITEGQISIIDMSGFNLWHLFKIHVGASMRFLKYVQEAMPIRIKGIHFINASPVADRALNIIKPFIKSELMAIINVHQGIETLYNFVPKEILPAEYGGNGPSLKQLQELHFKDLMENTELLGEAEKGEKADESKRIRRGIFSWR